MLPRLINRRWGQVVHNRRIGQVVADCDWSLLNMEYVSYLSADIKHTRPHAIKQRTCRALNSGEVGH